MVAPHLFIEIDGWNNLTGQSAATDAWPATTVLSFNLKSSAPKGFLSTTDNPVLCTLIGDDGHIAHDTEIWSYGMDADWRALP